MDKHKVISKTEILLEHISKSSATISNKDIKALAEKWVADYYRDLFSILISYPNAIKALKYLVKSVDNQRLLRKQWLKNLGIIKKSLNNLKFGGERQVLIFDSNKPFTAYQILKELFAKAKKGILIFDGYVEEDTLNILSGIRGNTILRILTNHTYGKFLKELPKFKKEFTKCEVKKSSIVHDRFFIIDGKCFVSGTSLHSIGAKKSSFILETEKNIAMILRNYFDNLWNQSSKIL